MRPRGWRPGRAEQVDATKPSTARVYNYLLGGKDNFAVDREAARKIVELVPDVAGVAVANYRWAGRAARYCARLGIDQVIDIGTGIPVDLPNSPSTFAAVRAHNPEALVVGIDNDPVVLRHGMALLQTNDHVRIVEGDVREPGQILDSLQGLIDFGRPVAWLIAAVLHFVTDEQDPGQIVAALAGASPPDSRVAVSVRELGGQSMSRLDHPHRGAADRSTARARAVEALAAELARPGPWVLFPVDASEGEGWSGRPCDAPYRSRGRTLPGASSSNGTVNPDETSTAPDKASAYLERLAAELERREWLVLLCAADDDAVLQVTHPVAQCLTDVVACRRSSHGAWQFCWAGGAPIGPVDEVGKAADLIIRELGLFGAKDGES